MADLFTITELRRELDEVLEELRNKIHDDFRKEIAHIITHPAKRLSGVHIPKRHLSTGPLDMDRDAKQNAKLTSPMDKEAKQSGKLAISPGSVTVQRSKSGKFAITLPPRLTHVTEYSDAGSELDGRNSLGLGGDSRSIPLVLSRDIQGKAASSRDIEAVGTPPGSRLPPSVHEQQYSMISPAWCDGYRQSPGLPDDGSHSDSWMCLGRLLTNPWFEYFIYVCIGVNSLLLGLETDYAARHSGKEYIDFGVVDFAIAEVIFCVIFSLELALRMCHHGVDMWRKKEWVWNCFDLVLVIGQLGELVTVHFRLHMPEGEHRTITRGDHITVLRILRVFRVVRFGRLRFFNEPREMLSSVLGSLKSFMWSAIMIFLLNYVVSIIVCQIACQGRLSREIQDIDMWFGGLGRTMLTMFESITGGLSWDSAVRPLIEISPVIGLVFCFYIAFCVLSILNVVTGTFVQRATKEARMHEDNMTANLIRDVFMKNDGDVLDEQFEAAVILIVEGAGGIGASMNGRYMQNGTHFGRPKFKQVDGDAIVYFDGHWKMNDVDSTAEWYYEAPDGPRPPAGTWAMHECRVGDATPPPSVSWQQEIRSKNGFANPGYANPRNSSPSGSAQSTPRTTPITMKNQLVRAFSDTGKVFFSRTGTGTASSWQNMDLA